MKKKMEPHRINYAHLGPLNSPCHLCKSCRLIIIIVAGGTNPRREVSDLDSGLAMHKACAPLTSSLEARCMQRTYEHKERRGGGRPRPSRILCKERNFGPGKALLSLSILYKAGTVTVTAAAPHESVPCGCVCVRQTGCNHESSLTLFLFCAAEAVSGSRSARSMVGPPKRGSSTKCDESQSCNVCVQCNTHRRAHATTQKQQHCAISRLVGSQQRRH